MSWTKAQKLAAELKDLKFYRFNLPPNDPDIPEATAIINYRDVDLRYYEEVQLPQYIIALQYARKNGLGPGGADSPPTPPPVP